MERKEVSQGVPTNPVLQAPDSPSQLPVDQSTSRCLQPTTDHPFAQAESNCSINSPVSSVDAASLIQSAAKSILDNVTRKSSVSDEEESYADGASAESVPSPTLRSLRTKKLPAIPDEQDRKRFIGCLAAVLASLYSYDTIDELDDATELSKAESMAYLNIDELDDSEVGGAPSLRHSVSGSFECSESSFQDDDSNHRTPPKKRISKNDLKRIRVYRARHRQRRYDVLSKLLLSAAEHLQLETMQAKAFLPVLARILVPQPRESEAQRGSRPPLWRDGSRKPEAEDMSQPLGVQHKLADRNLHRNEAEEFLDQKMDEIEHLRPFLESLTPGAGFRCLSMFLLNHLMTSVEGYDARVRHAIKNLGVLVLLHDLKYDAVDVIAQTCSGKNRKRSGLPMSLMLVTRKFESLEQRIAVKLLELYKEQEKARRGRGTVRPPGTQNSLTQQPKGITRQQLLRGMKIGGTAVVAGTLFAVTGGLAAPGIAAGVAALAGGTAATAAAAAVLTSTAALTAIFGVGGGGLAAYKMQRRTKGLTEFVFQKESEGGNDSVHGTRDRIEAELFTTVCLSGWLNDIFDFQRPWGVTPSNPRLNDPVELLERFYTIHRLDHVPKSASILASWKGEERHLWKLLRDKYGTDPSNLFPLGDGPRFRGALTLEQVEVIDGILDELGFPKSTTNSSARIQASPFERMRAGINKSLKRPEGLGPSQSEIPAASGVQQRRSASYHGVHSFDSSSIASIGDTSSSTSNVDVESDVNKERIQYPKHIATVWDYKANYGGELYTVKWESDLLIELCDSVTDLAFDIVSGGTTQILKHTALSTLLSAVALPYALVNVANMIDGVWTLAVERSDEAGKELARSLIFSNAGNRPVTLVGFSFGARTIYSCLKELARYQEKWEDFFHLKDNDKDKRRGKGDKAEQVTEVQFENMREPASIVEDVIVMGLPNHLSLSSWRICRQLVAGRLVNCYSQKDLILSLMFQFKRPGLKPVCGTCPVEVPGVENFDVSDLILGHQDYCLHVGDILKRVRHGEPFRSTVPNRAAMANSSSSRITYEVSKMDIGHV